MLDMDKHYKETASLIHTSKLWQPECFILGRFVRNRNGREKETRLRVQKLGFRDNDVLRGKKESDKVMFHLVAQLRI